MTFLELYGTELDRELGSNKTDLFTTVRRKAAINFAQLEWNERTECYTRQTTVSLSDGTQEYDLEASITDFHCLSKQGVSIKIVDGTETTYIEGDDLEVTTVARLNVDEPGWRSVSAGTPRKLYLRRDGGSVYLGFHPAPDIGTETWTAIVPYVAIPADMSLDADEPFSISSNPIKSLRPYHRALVHQAAFDLEKLRKDQDRMAIQKQLFEEYVQRYSAKEKPKGGQHVRFGRIYRGTRRVSARLDPRVFP
jgi:hypothetical protein